MGRDVDVLVEKACHHSVNRERLTETRPSLSTRYLHDMPLIDYLRVGEQPHFVFAARHNSVTVRGDEPPAPEPTAFGTGMVMHMITDQRWLTVAGNPDGDQRMSVPLSEITAVEGHRGGEGSHLLQLATDEYAVDVPIADLFDDEDIDAACQWLLEQTAAEAQNEVGAGGEPRVGNVITADTLRRWLG